MNHISSGKYECEKNFKTVGGNGGSNGELKIWQRCFQNVAQEPKDVFVWRQEQCVENIFVFLNIKLYKKIVSKFRKNHKTFLSVLSAILQVNEKVL